jgi:transcriptional regulator with XRE-family HTH domain
MKRIQCTKCKQVFWVELQLDEALVENGEWIQIPCPRCGSEWAVVKPGRRMPEEARKRIVKPPAPRWKAGPLHKEESLSLTPARIFSLRKKLGLSQADLGALVGVDRGSVLSREKGKFKPKAEKAAQLAALATKGKEEVRKLLGEKMPEQETKPKQSRKRRTDHRKKVPKAPEKWVARGADNGTRIRRRIKFGPEDGHLFGHILRLRLSSCTHRLT